MKKPKLQIIVLFQNLGDTKTYFARSPAPPASGTLLAALTPSIVEVELLHEMVRPIDYNTDADFIALSFMDWCAPHAFEVAARFREKGKKVIAGGNYATGFPEMVSPHMDATVVGEAHPVWGQVVEDLVNGQLKKIYKSPINASLENIPPPRYDLVESDFFTPVVTEATRGCPYRCWFCQLTIKPVPYRTRPIKDVIRDLTATKKLPFTKRKIAMLLDNNLAGDLEYAKELLREIAKIKLWGLGVQISIDSLLDDEFVDLLEQANCCMAFIGMESLNQESLASVQKNHNKVEEYQQLFMKLKKRGILTFTGVMFGLDEDTVEYYDTLPQRIDLVDPSAILISISIPIPGTPFFRKLDKDGRIFDYDLSHYEGDHLVFYPKNMTDDDVFEGVYRLNKYFYSWKNIFRRWWRFVSVMSFKRGFFITIFRMILQSVILFKLSVFNRHHAKKKVYAISELKNAV